MNHVRAGRIAAAGIAAVTWFGLAVQLVVVYREQGSVLVTLGIVSAFFTITTNLLVAMVFSAIALDRTSLREDWIVAGTVLSILLVGVSYALLLHGLLELSGGSALANVLLHMVTPVIVLLYWIFFARKGGLSWRDPLLWAIYPLLYLAYALVRGGMTEKYAYPFINVIKLGWGRTALNAVCIAIAFMACSFAVVWIDQRVGARAAEDL